MKEIDGQLAMFGPPPEQASRRRRRRSPRVSWLGPGRCRACHGRLLLYQTSDGLRAWVQPDLVPTCPGCGIALTTTTTTVTTNDSEGAVP